MNRRRHRQQLLLCCVYAIVAMSLIVTGTTSSSSSSLSSSSSSSLGGPPPCVFATASDALDGCVTRSPAELLPDRIRRDGVGDAPLTSLVATSLEGRGKKKKKNTMMNIILGGGIMTMFVMTFMYLNLITVTLGKAFLFTFISKFLVSVNWKSSSSYKEKSSDKEVTVITT